MKKFIVTVAAGLLVFAVACSDRQGHAADETTGSSAATSSYGTGGAMGPSVVEVTGSGTTSTTGSGAATPTGTAAPAKTIATPARPTRKP